MAGASNFQNLEDLINKLETVKNDDFKVLIISGNKALITNIQDLLKLLKTLKNDDLKTLIILENQALITNIQDLPSLLNTLQDDDTKAFIILENKALITNIQDLPSLLNTLQDNRTKQLVIAALNLKNNLTPIPPKTENILNKALKVKTPKETLGCFPFLKKKIDHHYHNDCMF